MFLIRVCLQLSENLGKIKWKRLKTSNNKVKVCPKVVRSFRWYSEKRIFLSHLCLRRFIVLREEGRKWRIFLAYIPLKSLKDSTKIIFHRFLNNICCNFVILVWHIKIRFMTEFSTVVYSTLWFHQSSTKHAAT